VKTVPITASETRANTTKTQPSKRQQAAKFTLRYRTRLAARAAPCATPVTVVPSDGGIYLTAFSLFTFAFCFCQARLLCVRSGTRTSSQPVIAMNWATSLLVAGP